MKIHNETRLVIRFILPLILMSSCTEEYIQEISLGKEEVGSFKDFKVTKIKGNVYEIKFDKLLRNNGVLFFEKDTIFISLDSCFSSKRIPLFIKNNFLETYDTLKLNKNEEKVVVIRRESIICNNVSTSQLIFISKTNPNKAYTINFSFEKGFLQILLRDLICVEVIDLTKKFEYHLINKDGVVKSI